MDTEEIGDMTYPAERESMFSKSQHSRLFSGKVGIDPNRWIDRMQFLLRRVI
jgi:hypothetical protein